MYWPPEVESHRDFKSRIACTSFIMFDERNIVVISHNMQYFLNNQIALRKDIFHLDNEIIS